MVKKNDTAQTLADFHVEAIIGKGSFGKVSRIRYKRTGEIFVWKELFYGHMDEKEKKLLIQEVNIFKQLDHENIVKFRGTINDKHNRTLFLVQEHCNFQDLGKLIKDRADKQRTIGEKLVWRVFEHCLAGLLYLHPKVLHRDMKPQNIMLTRDSHGQIFAKIGDFGLSRILSTNTIYAQSRVGTPYYMSPEQITGQGYDEKADIWSLGCILYELCTGSRPFTGRTIEELTKNIRSGKKKPISNRYSHDIIAAVSSMLSTKPVMRPYASELMTLIAPARRKMTLQEKSYHLSKEIVSVQKVCEDRRRRMELYRENTKKKWIDLEADIKVLKKIVKRKRQKYLLAFLEKVEESSFLSIKTQSKVTDFIHRLLRSSRVRIQEQTTYIQADRTLFRQDSSKSHGSPSNLLFHGDTPPKAHVYQSTAGMHATPNKKYFPQISNSKSHLHCADRTPRRYAKERFLLQACV